MASKEAQKKWKALESNPDVLTQLGRKLGLSDKWAFADIFGFDEDLLAMLPQPCHAVLLLFPSTTKIANSSAAANEEVFFLKQIPELGNACGTIAILHAFANKQVALGFESDSIISTFISQMKEKSPLERGECLNDNEAINALHNALAQEGQTSVIEGKVNFHFVSFFEVNGNLFEADGTKEQPIHHGTVGEKGLLKAAVSKIQEIYVAPNPDVLEFAMIGLCPPMAW